MSKSLKMLQKVLIAICVCFLLGMLFCISIQVVFRYVLLKSIPWAEEFARMFYIWLVCLTLPVLESFDDQLKVTYFFDKIPIKFRKVMYEIFNVVYILVLIIFFVGAYKSMIGSWSLTFSVTPWLKTGIQYIPLLIAAPCSIVFIIYRMLHPDEFLKKLEEETMLETTEEEGENL